MSVGKSYKFSTPAGNLNVGRETRTDNDPFSGAVIMRCRCVVPIVVLILAVVASSARAEALLQTLPEDGDWVQFHANMNVGGLATTPTWTAKSVGKKEIAGEKYRWIELQSKDEERNVLLVKCLVAEAEFGKGKNPLAQAKQVFVKYGKQEPREVASLAVADGPLALILAGPAEAKKLEKKESVDVQNGRIECEVFTGRSKSEIGNAKFEISHRLLMSDEVPYRLVAAKFQIDADFSGNKFAAAVELTLKETGKNAKSELPMIE
jgi:hypothetical protein